MADDLATDDFDETKYCTVKQAMTIARVHSMAIYRAMRGGRGRGELKQAPLASIMKDGRRFILISDLYRIFGGPNNV